jgi:hypothetical protein
VGIMTETEKKFFSLVIGKEPTRSQEKRWDALMQMLYHNCKRESDTSFKTIYNGGEDDIRRSV